MEVTLIGMGLGDPTTLTAQAVRALEGADGLIGARRLVEGLNLGREVPRYPATKGTEILEILCRSGLERPCVLYSGDTGFYSGARSLTALLEKEGIPFRVLPGPVQRPVSGRQAGAALAGLEAGLRPRDPVRPGGRRAGGAGGVFPHRRRAGAGGAVPGPAGCRTGPPPGSGG